MPLSAEGSLWRFALVIYRRPGVSEACLAFQDSFGADVNLLIYACWLAVERNVTLDAASAAQAEAGVAPWRSEIVTVLRSLRRRLKTGPLPAPSDATAKLREAIKAAELKSEQIELEWLEAHAPARNTPNAAPGHVAATALANLHAVLGENAPAARAYIDVLLQNLTGEPATSVQSPNL